MAQSATQTPLSNLWTTVLEAMRPLVSHAAFNGLLRQIRPLSFDGDTLVLGVPSEATRSLLVSQHLEQLQAQVRACLGQGVRVRLDVVTSAVGRSPAVPHVVRGQSGSRIGIGGDPAGLYDPFGAVPLNPRYTFENFVVADCNRFAHAAAMQVARAPGRSYNPLFIHSKAGLGKTHLMQAIGHRIKQQYPEAEVVYISAENFVNYMISAIRDNTIDAFRARFRRVDVWLVDDIQFIAAIEGPASEEEFFHTFNTLYETGKQVVIASDAPPRGLRLMNERLRSRLEMGIVADLRCPDLETRIAILEKKAEAEGVVLSREVLELIAKRIESNIRVLEGALTKVCAYISLTGHMPGLAEVEDLIADYSSSSREHNVSMAEIAEAVARRFGVEVEDLLGPKRQKDIMWARQVAIYLCRELTNSSLAAIGEFFGGRDHSTVLHSYNKVADRLTDDESVLFLINDLKSQLTAG